MTREEAKEILEEVKVLDDSMYQYNPAYLEALEMAIAALKAEPCEDAVSRKHLLLGIDELMQSPWFNNGKDDDKFTHFGYVERKEAVEIVRDLCVKTEPPVTPKRTAWIPVSERLPEVMDGANGECSDDVLICVADDEYVTISTGFYGYYPRSISQQGWWSMWAYGCHQLDSKYKVIAWMPLPQPYKAESEGDDGSVIDG